MSMKNSFRHRYALERLKRLGLTDRYIKSCEQEIRAIEKKHNSSHKKVRRERYYI